ncbi:hypothetical protein ACQPZX_04570 [Actinoplanes sp. CA-142083]|uniref:hypothetical protein n=1 Tax=Actinoplanes sp. CA-142083 TaxID=3239903 RepID=UPI003D9167B7
MLRKLAAIGLPLVLVAGCTFADNGKGFLEFCGTTIDTPPAVPVPDRLRMPGPAPDGGHGPTRDILPPKPPWDFNPPNRVDEYLEVSQDCDKGVVVNVDPVNNVYLIEKAEADDGHLAGLVLTLTGGPVTIQAWRGGVFAGSLRVGAE